LFLTEPAAIDDRAVKAREPVSLFPRSAYCCFASRLSTLARPASVEAIYLGTSTPSAAGDYKPFECEILLPLSRLLPLGFACPSAYPLFGDSLSFLVSLSFNPLRCSSFSSIIYFELTFGFAVTSLLTHWCT
jgi:hypothetical protein